MVYSAVVHQRSSHPLSIASLRHHSFGSFLWPNTLAVSHTPVVNSTMAGTGELIDGYAKVGSTLTNQQGCAVERLCEACKEYFKQKAHTSVASGGALALQLFLCCNTFD